MYTHINTFWKLFNVPNIIPPHVCNHSRVFPLESVAPVAFWLTCAVKLHTHSAAAIMCLTRSLTAFTTAYLCAYGCSLMWLEIILSERRTEDNVSCYYYIIISPPFCPRLCRRTQWMAITCGWRRAVLESSVISERTPACWRPQWVDTHWTLLCLCSCSLEN